MNPPDNTPADHNPPTAAPLPDATIEMERPAISAPPKIVAPDATLEMERPKDLKKPVAIPDATVDMQRPAITASASPDATMEMARPGDLRKPVAIPDATVEVQRPVEKDGSHFQPERRAAARASGTFEVEIQKPLPSYTKKLGEVLIQMGKMSPEHVAEAVQYARESGERLGRCLIRWGVVPPDVVCRALSIQTGLPMTVLDDGSVPEKLAKTFPLALMMHHGFVPFDESPTVLCVAASNPLEPELIKDLEKSSKKVIEIFLAREDHVDRQLDWLRIKLKTRSRRTLRFQKNVTAAFQFCTRQGVRTEKSILNCQTVNVSEGGFLLDSPAPEIGDPGEALRKGLYINLCLKHNDEEIWSICEVRELRMNEIPGSNAPARWLMGVEIIDITPDFKRKLKELCRHGAKKSGF